SDIKSDPAGSVIVFGDFNGATASIGTHSVTNDSSTTSMFLGYLDALGTSLSLETFGGKYTTNSNCLDVASNGELLIAGKTVGKKMELGNLTVNQPTNGTFMFVGKTSSLLTGINKNHQVKVQHLLYPNPCATKAYLEFNGNVE